MAFFVNGLSSVQQLQQVELEQANVRLKKLALSTEQLAQTRERNRLARELHDTLAHTLSSVAVQLEAVKVLFDTDPVEAKRVLNRSLENTRNGLNETRRALNDLRTSEVENFGLNQSLKNLLTSGSTRSGFTYTENLQDNLNLLPPEISHVTYRTIQEAVENTVKHANATHVDLNVELTDTTLYLCYKDDGQGFPMNIGNDVRHYGLQGMRERIELLGGVFEIHSAPGEGTVITIEMEIMND
jgi:signal transduction histidine kinase